MADINHLENGKNRHFSTKNRPISMKFGTQMQMWISMTVTWPDVKIQGGGHRQLKIVFGHNSTAYYPISVNFAQGSRIAWP